MGLDTRRVSERLELDAIYRFRFSIYRDELGAPVPEDSERGRQLTDTYDSISYHYASFRNGSITGCLRAFDYRDVPNPESLIRKYSLDPALQTFGPRAIGFAGRLVIERGARRSGLMMRLLTMAMTDARERRIRVGFFDCSPYLLPVYEGLGLRRYAPPFNDPVFGLKIPLLFLLGDAEGLSRDNSPLATIAAEYGDDEEARAWYERQYAGGEFRRTGVPHSRDDFVSGVLGLLGETVDSPSSLFRGLSQQQIAVILRKCASIQVNTGDLIIRAGLNENFLFVILKGRVQVLSADGSATPIATLGRGECLGEIAFLTGGSRTKDVMAAEPCELLLINGDILDQVIEHDPGVARKLLKNLSVALAQRVARQ